jgi:hypothetical protein
METKKGWLLPIKKGIANIEKKYANLFIFHKSLIIFSLSAHEGFYILF